MPSSSNADRKIGNKMKRSAVHQAAKRDKAKSKLSNRLARKKEEAANPALKAERLAKNVPRTVENSRVYVGEEMNDKRTMPVQVLDADALKLDMAGLEDLFAAEDASTGESKLLLTTTPKPDKKIHPFLAELKSLFGGDDHVDVRVRKNQRFELSKVCKWAAKRGYKALVVVGELHHDSTTVTMSRLPEGPTAHFRVTSITPSKKIFGHGAPTSHAPELVLSNMSTPLGLSVGRLLQSLFPVIPHFEGRQVVAVHNSRDFIFFRRFRYAFSLREDELSVERAKERGMDTLVRAKMQEIGPRMTWKLRWIKRGTVASGRRRANGTIIGVDTMSASNGQFTSKETLDDEQLSDDDAVIEDAAAAELEEQVPEIQQSETQVPSFDEEEQEIDEDVSAIPPTSKRKRTSSELKIPRLQVPQMDLEVYQQQRRKKPKANASILDSIHLQGGVKDSEKEWAWKSQMQLKKNRFFL